MAFPKRHSTAARAGCDHELTHWTRHASRLDREFGRKRWGDAGYAAEELVAELGVCVLSADLGINAEPRDDHSSYLASWLEVAEERQPRHLHRRRACTTCCRLLHDLQQQEAIAAE